MATDATVVQAMAIGKAQAQQILELRAQAQQSRTQALATHPQPMHFLVQPVDSTGAAFGQPSLRATAGILVAEGDSWFDYPLHDVLKELDDRHGYDVESIAHHGDPIEEMAYGAHQLDDFSRRLEKVVRAGNIPKAILLSGGGNDVAGDEFGMLLNHAKSPIAGLNITIVDAVINQRIFSAYLTILNAVTEICKNLAGKVLPILVHGYDYPVPDGRGFAGGWGPLPGPWLDPGFREKGFPDKTAADRQRRITIAHDLIERFNKMVERLPTIQGMQHIHYVDLRNTLRTDTQYQEWWANELHPTKKGFRVVTDKFAAVLAALPS